MLPLLFLIGCGGGSSSDVSNDGDGVCTTKLTRGVLDKSLEIGTSFMLNNQKPAGNFTYEYDYLKKKYSKGDNSVRQAGATWGLGLILNETGNPEIVPALEKAFDFWLKNSVLLPDGRRFIVYPSDKRGSLGTVALVTLAHIETHRAGKLSPERQKHMNQYLDFLLGVHDGAGRFPNFYRHTDGLSGGKPSPYSEGETLLAMIKAAKYAGRTDLKPVIFKVADAGYEANVTKARQKDPDSDTTKGYYQWSSMCYHELATADDWPEDREKYGDWLIELAYWMIDTHRTLKRTRNTGYAYEGIVSAYDMAKRKGDDKSVKKIGCTIGQGMEKLTSWQVGSPIPNEHLAMRPTDDPLAIGGVQNHAFEAPLRIDVAQHQMHAVILARKYWPAPK